MSQNVELGNKANEMETNAGSVNAEEVAHDPNAREAKSDTAGNINMF